MARRGANNAERFALDAETLTATGTVQAGPLALYQATITLNDTNATGELSLSDVTATAAADFTAVDRRILKVRLGAGGLSANSGGPLVWTPPKPVYVKRDVGMSASNTFVSILFYPEQ